MVEIHLYGKLRRYAQDIQSDRGNVIRVSPGSDETLGMLLARLEIPVDEIYSIFFNFSYVHLLTIAKHTIHLL